jgi:hypothetical protein
VQRLAPLVVVAALSLPAQPAEAGLWRWLSGASRSKHAQQVRQIRKNQRDGARRETFVQAWLNVRHPFSKIQPQRTLVNKKGVPIIDRVTGEVRRFDFAVIGPTGRLVRLVETTSRTASKTEQEAKTARILKHGKTFIIDARNDKLRRVRDGWLLPTHIGTIRTYF